MASKKQYAFIVFASLWVAVLGASNGISDGAVGVTAGLMGGFAAGLLLSSAGVSYYNSRTEDEVITVEDVQ